MSVYTTDTKIKLHNKTSMVEVYLHGGAITDFHLSDNPVNPLSFHFSKEQMPANNKAGAAYQGHFICAGRWGEPSAGEVNAGIPNHGEPANIEWQLNETADTHLSMEVTASLEGLHIRRRMQLDPKAAICHVEETIKNIHPLGRLYQFVQHPTIAAPFLNETTIINCNATLGFDYKYMDTPNDHKVNWPLVSDESRSQIDLRNSQQDYNSVFSFIVNSEDHFGWVTAYSPEHNLIVGYLWNRKDYPWINLWQHFENGVIKYRGLEFGTTGLHQPFRKIIENNNLEVFGEPAFAYIDAGEELVKGYTFFLISVKKGFNAVEKIEINNGMISVVENGSKDRIEIGRLNFYKHQ
ncbi:MAG: hypothetical protein ABI861_04700 [Panacibacter sp.]